MSRIEIELPYHLTTPSRGGHGHWTTKSRDVRAKRTLTSGLLEIQMERNARSGRAFTREVVSKGRNGKPLKEPYVRNVLSPEWKANLDRGIVVRFTRFAPQSLDKDDNLRAAFKAIKDGVTDALGIDDSEREKRVEWIYAPQVKDPRSHAMVSMDWTPEGDPAR